MHLAFFLRSHQTIQKFTAALLLLVFSLSATPKKFFHTAFANHKDRTAKASHTDNKTPQISIATINCQCDNLVATSTFTNTSETPQLVVPVAFVLSEQKSICNLVISKHYHFELRGPPSLSI